MAAEASMKEVVQRLRFENGEALQELLEFGHAFDKFLESLERLAAASHELHAATCNVIGSGEKESPRQRVVRELADRLFQGIAQFSGAFRQMHGAVRGWDIPGTRGDSNLPSSGTQLVSSG